MKERIGWIAMAILLFLFGIQVGEYIVLSAVREVCGEYRIPTKGEGFRSNRGYEEKYNEQAHKLRR